MAYDRLTYDEYHVQGKYCAEYEYETVYSSTDKSDAMARFREYVDNERQYSHRLIIKRIRKGYNPNDTYQYTDRLGNRITFFIKSGMIVSGEWFKGGHYYNLYFYEQWLNGKGEQIGDTIYFRLTDQERAMFPELYEQRGYSLVVNNPDYCYGWTC